jgi:hypothetical protein
LFWETEMLRKLEINRQNELWQILYWSTQNGLLNKTSYVFIAQSCFNTFLVSQFQFNLLTQQIIWKNRLTNQRILQMEKQMFIRLLSFWKFMTNVLGI